jgi:hypothetical protein
MINSQGFRSKWSYQSKGKRTQITTTINETILNEFRELILQYGQPQTKALDVVLLMITESDDMRQKFIKRLREY